MYVYYIHIYKVIYIYIIHIYTYIYIYILYMYIYENDKQRVRNYSTSNATSSFMFLVEYSILIISIARSVSLYSAQQLRKITKNIF